MEKKMGQKNGQEKRQKTKAEYKNISREELMQEISGQENARTEEEKEARKNAYYAYVKPGDAVLQSDAEYAESISGGRHHLLHWVRAL